MHIVLRTMAVMATGAFAAIPAAADTKLPVVEILGNRYYVYEAKKGDTLFGIARQYGWDDRELRRLNPKAVSPLTKGFKVYYPSEYSSETAVITVEDPSELPMEPINHLVKRGETVYSISTMYSIPIDRIYALNPDSREGIREGEILKLKNGDSDNTDGNPDYYTVKTGDTLYKIARQYNTTVAAVLRLNPGVTERNFRSGEIIRLPDSGQGVKTIDKAVEETKVVAFNPYTVEKDDTWTSISEKTGVSREDLINANRNVRKLKKKDVIGIPQIETDSVVRTGVYEDPRELTDDGVNLIYDDVHGLNTDMPAESVSIALILSDPAARKDLDFTRGFLTGIDRLKREDYKINLKVIDGTAPSSDIISQLGDYNPDMVFTTSDKNVPGYLSDYALVSQTPIVNTFDVKDETFHRNPYFIQLLTPSNYFNEEIADNISTTYGNSDLILVGTPDASDQLASTLKGKWDESHIYSLAGPEELSSISFSLDGNYVIYGYETKKTEIADLLTAVKKVRDDNPIARIGLLGRPSWIVYDESLARQLHDADALIPSRFFYDKDSREAGKFLLEYKSLFDMQPVKSYPMYAAVGYDASLYFIPTVAATGGDLNKFGTGTDAVQSNFSLERPTNWSGMMNPIVYLVRFTPYDSIEKMEVK